jgi:hypothetical protein
VKNQTIIALIATAVLTGCASPYAFKDLGDGRGVRGLMGAPMGEVYQAAAMQSAAAMNLQAAQTPQTVNVWHSGTVHHDVTGTIQHNVNVSGNAWGGHW